MKLAAVCAITLFTIPILRAQAPPQLAFKSATVRVNHSGSLSMTPPPDGTYTADNQSLGMLIRHAYKLSRPEMTGGPSWLETERFDIRAEYGIGTPQEDRLAMLRTLLQDRFKLQTHLETKTMQVYELTALKPGELGPWIVPSLRDCTKEPRPKTMREVVDTGDVPCGMVISFPPAPAHRLSGIASDFSAIPDMLNVLGHLDGPVLDHTGITGRFDFDLTWTPMPDQYPVRPGLPGPVFGTPIFSAVQTELGLKLESRTGPVNILVIDHVERPTEN